MGRCLNVPWGGPPPCYSKGPGAKTRAPLYLSYHESKPDSGGIPTKLDHFTSVRDWRGAKELDCDCPFWGPSAFLTNDDEVRGEAVLETCHRTTCMHSTSSSYSSNFSNLSVQVGGGVGNMYLGATVSGKYDKSVMDDQKKCQNSMTSYTIAGAVGLDRNPPFTGDASRLLEEHGPDLFEKIFGSHFVWKVIAGAESGFCLSMGDSSHTERESMSVVVDINLFFWSTSVEKELLSKVESHLSKSFNLDCFDTLTNAYHHDNGTALSMSVLFDRAKTIRDNVGKLEERLARQLQEITSSAGALLTSEEMSTCVIGVLVAPWTVLDEWHAGVKKWRATHHQ